MKNEFSLPGYSTERPSDAEMIDRSEMGRAVDWLQEQDVRNRKNVVGPLRRIFELLRRDVPEFLPDGDYEGFDEKQEKGFRRRISDEMERLKWSMVERWQVISERDSLMSGDVELLLSDLLAMDILSKVRMSTWTLEQKKALERVESLQAGSYVEVENAVVDLRNLLKKSVESPELPSPVSETAKTEGMKPLETRLNPTIEQQRDLFRYYIEKMPPWEIIRSIEEEIRKFREISVMWNGPSDKDIELFADRLSGFAAELAESWRVWRIKRAYQDRLHALSDVSVAGGQDKTAELTLRATEKVLEPYGGSEVIREWLEYEAGEGSEKHEDGESTGPDRGISRMFQEL